MGIYRPVERGLRMRKIAGAIVAIISAQTAAHADLLIGWNVAGLSGTELSVNAAYVAPNVVSTTVLTRGSGLSTNPGTNSLNSASWAMPAHSTVASTIASNDYYTIRIIADPGFTLDLTNFVYRNQRSTTGPSNITLRTSADGFASDVASWTVASTVPNDISTPLNITGVTDIELRIYAAGAIAFGGTLRVADGGNHGAPGIDLAVFGTVVPEPGTFALLVAGLGVVTAVRKRRMRDG